MAKMIKHQLKKLLERQLSNISYKLKVTVSYVPIIENRLNERKNRKLENYQFEMNKQLYEAELATFGNHQYVEEMTKEKVDLLKEKTYWRKRAVLTSFKREYKSVDNQNAHQKELDDLLTKVDHIEKEQLTKLNGKYASRNMPEGQIEINLKLFRELYIDLQLKYNADEIQLTHELETKLEYIKKKAENKKQRLNASYERKSLKLKSLLDEIKDSSIAEGVVMSDDSILKLDNLTMLFGGLRAVDKLSFEVKEGEIFGLIGPNGAGKTTVFNCITQFYKSNSGQIIYRNKVNDVVNLGQYKVHDVIKQGIVRTFQNVELIWELSILDNLLIASHTLYKTGFFEHLVHTMKFRREEEILKARAINILTNLGLLVYKDFYPIGLPYGTLKLVELARTLMTNPRLIILDEPAAGLNDQETKKLAETIRKIQKEYNSTIFLVEHDMGLVMELCDTICAISFGKMLAIGTAQEIQANPIVQEAYLGGE